MSWFTQARDHAINPNVRPRSRAGFTLIELVIVMVIVSTVGAIAIPRYGRAVAHYRLSSSLNRVVADINAARSLAMATSKTQTITFSAFSNTYTVTGLKSLENNPSIYTTNLSAEPYNANITFVSFGFLQQTVSFDAYGTPDNSGTIQLICGGVTKGIWVDATGKAVVP